MKDAEYAEEYAANRAWIEARDSLIASEMPIEDMQAATVAALWRALEIAADDLSKDALRRMVFGEESPAQAAPSAGEVERDRWRDREYEAWHRGFVERCGDEPVPREAWRAALSHKEQP